MNTQDRWEKEEKPKALRLQRTLGTKAAAGCLRNRGVGIGLALILLARRTKPTQH